MATVKMEGENVAIISSEGNAEINFNGTYTQGRLSGQLGIAGFNAKCDGAALPDLARRLRVVRYPTLLLLHRERELARVTGAMNLAQLLAWAPPHRRRLGLGSIARRRRHVQGLVQRFQNINRLRLIFHLGRNLV